MRIHRFYVSEAELLDNFWFKDSATLHQWNKVLRFRNDQKVILFNSHNREYLYEIIELTKSKAHLKRVADVEQILPDKDIYLFWSLLKKDKNDWVLQKSTELGVNHFMPIIADRSEKTGFNIERANKIVIEASEQCGRSNIPKIHNVMPVKDAVSLYKDKLTMFICQQGADLQNKSANECGLFIGPEGGWSNDELEFFNYNNILKIVLSDFTLRAETAAVVAISKMFA